MLFQRKAAVPVALPAAAAETNAQPRRRKGWFEKRRERRKKRRLFEEIIAWIVVPALIYGVYLAYKAVGGLPPAALEFLQEIVSMVLRGGK
jgi:hypothetical protein